jgi:hypothetical protein
VFSFVPFIGHDSHIQTFSSRSSNVKWQGSTSSARPHFVTPHPRLDFVQAAPFALRPRLGAVGSPVSPSYTCQNSHRRIPATVASPACPLPQTATASSHSSSPADVARWPTP